MKPLCLFVIHIFNKIEMQESSRRLTINWLAVLSHHRAYRSVHGGSLVFINY